MKKQYIIILSSLLSLSSDVFALVASDIDMQPVVTDVTTIVVSLLSFLVMLMGFKKVLSLLGR